MEADPGQWKYHHFSLRSLIPLREGKLKTWRTARGLHGDWFMEPCACSRLNSLRQIGCKSIQSRMAFGCGLGDLRICGSASLCLLPEQSTWSYELSATSELLGLGIRLRLLCSIHSTTQIRKPGSEKACGVPRLLLQRLFWH